MREVTRKGDRQLLKGDHQDREKQMAARRAATRRRLSARRRQATAVRITPERKLLREGDWRLLEKGVQGECYDCKKGTAKGGRLTERK